MRFSIIIPVFNTELYLRQCLDSILSQSFTDFEVICVDDGSTDGSFSILQSYVEKDERVKVFKNPKKGVSSARNLGLDVMRGEYVLFVDSDDWILQDSLLKFDKVIRQCNPSILVYPSKRYLESQDKFVEDLRYEESEYENGSDYYENIAENKARDSFGTICGKVYGSGLLKSNKIQFCEDLSYHEDLLFLMDVCACAGTVQVIPDVCYVYRIRKAGSLMTTNTNERCMNMAMLANELGKRHLSNPDLPYLTLCRTISSYYRNSLALGGKKALPALKKQIDWSVFRKASRCSIKSRLAFFGLRIMPFVVLSLLAYRNERQIEKLSLRDKGYE